MPVLSPIVDDGEHITHQFVCRIHMNVPINMHVRTHTDVMYVCMYALASMHIRVYVCILDMHGYMYSRTHLHVCILMCISEYMQMVTIGMQIYVCTWTVDTDMQTLEYICAYID